MNRRALALLAVCLGLGATTGAAAQGLPGEIGGELAAGKNLTGDECKLRRVAPGGWGNAAQLYLVYCEGWTQASGALAVFPRTERPLMGWIEESQWAKDIRDAGECEAPKAEARLEGFDAVTRRCLNRQGWRRLMLAAYAGKSAYMADFLPNNAPLIDRALMAAAGRAPLAPQAAQGERMVALRALEEVFGKEAQLPSIKEIGGYIELRDFAWNLQEARFYRKSELAFQRVLSIQERIFGLDSPSLAVTLQLSAYTVRNQRRPDDAMAIVERAERIVARTRDPVLVSEQLIHRSFDASARGNRAAAAEFAEKALAVLGDGRSHRGQLASGNYALATARFYAGNLAGAEEAARVSYRYFAQVEGEQGVWANRSRMILAKALAEQKKLPEAKTWTDSALKSAELMYGRTIWWANAKVIEGRIRFLSGDAKGAVESYREFAGVASRSQFACYFPPCISPYLDLLAQQAALDEAFTAAQLFESPVVSTAIGQLAARAGADDAQVASFTREQQDLVERQNRVRAQLLAETRKPENQRSADKEAPLADQLRQLTTQESGLELALQDRFPHYAQLVSRQPVQASRIAALLRPDEGLLYLSQAGDKSYTFLLYQGRITMHMVPLAGTELKKRVAALRRGLTIQGGTLQVFDTALAHSLYRDLVGPLLDGRAELRRLVVVPSGPLLSLPPDVLITEPPDRADKQAWLARRYALTVAPSVRALADLRSAVKPAAAMTSFLGVGDPLFGANAASAAPAKRAVNPCSDPDAARAQVAALDPLPETAGEVRAMSKALGATEGDLLLGAKATKSAVMKSNLEAKGILAFATHGLLPEDLSCENEPSLALTPGSVSDVKDDGLLRASEIAALRLNASVVILSACNTAGADGQLGGESLSGLVRAFFFAGARNVLATHWPIASEPTVALTTDLVRDAAAGTPWSDALRKAKLRMMDDPKTSHPFFWGAFSLIGGG